MQYFFLPAALMTASGMLANAAPLNGGNKEAADLQPLAAPATNAGESLVVQWKPAAKNSAWKHMDVSLVALLANGKQHETSLAHGIDGTDPKNNTLHAKAPQHVHGDAVQYLIKFSDGKDEKKSPKFAIHENKASKQHGRRNSDSGINKEHIGSIIQEMLGSGDRGSSSGHGSSAATAASVPSAASSSLQSKASSKHKPITISGVTYYPKIGSSSKSKSGKKSSKSKSTSATNTPDSRDAWSDMAQQMEADEKHGQKGSSSASSSEHGRNAAATKIPTASPTSSGSSSKKHGHSKSSSSKKHGHSKSSSSSSKKHDGHDSHGHHGGAHGHNGHDSHGHHNGTHGHGGKSKSSESKKHHHSSESRSVETSSSPSSSSAPGGRSAVQQQGGGNNGGGSTGGELKVDTPSFAAQCQPLKINWHGGKAPYTPYITAEGDVGNVLDSLKQTQDTTTTWKVTVPEGQKFTINMCDADGICKPSGPVGPVAKGSDSCTNGGGAPPKKRFVKREESSSSRSSSSKSTTHKSSSSKPIRHRANKSSHKSSSAQTSPSHHDQAHLRSLLRHNPSLNSSASEAQGASSLFLGMDPMAGLSSLFHHGGNRASRTSSLPSGGSMTRSRSTPTSLSSHLGKQSASQGSSESARGQATRSLNDESSGESDSDLMNMLAQGMMGDSGLSPKQISRYFHSEGVRTSDHQRHGQESVTLDYNRGTQSVSMSS